MADHHSAFPFFAPVQPRALFEAERSVTELMLHGLDTKYKAQLASLIVVGRCGCECCPTVFFQSHSEGDAEHDLVSFVGPDFSGGLTAAVLMEKNGVLSQLEFYSVDGHDPWSIPMVESLAPY
jgi:hypothetical protein